MSVQTAKTPVPHTLCPLGQVPFGSGLSLARCATVPVLMVPPQAPSTRKPKSHVTSKRWDVTAD